jgi:hypothetical protein
MKGAKKNKKEKKNKFNLCVFGLFVQMENLLSKGEHFFFVVVSIFGMEEK